MSRSSRDTGHSCDSRSRSGISVQGPALRAVPVASCLHQSRGGGPCSPERTRGAHPQLPRRLAHTCTVSRAVARTQGPGAQAPQPVGPSGSTGKRANSCQHRGSLFSAWSWIRSTRQHASPRNVLSRCWTASRLYQAGRRSHWNSFRGSWGIWLQLRQ